MPAPSPAQPPIASYDDALRYLDQLDVSAMKLGLSRIQQVLASLGDPQEQLPMVHIAGTNGKGSVTAMLGSLLKAAGYTVGTFTSPHLIHVRERIAINGNPILPDDFQYEVASLAEHLNTLNQPRNDWPTYFEFLNIVAYQYFRRKNVDFTLFETGLGGRLDSTNVIQHPRLTVITGIGLDHTQLLGDSPDRIAAEKAGILKAGTPLVLADGLDPLARAVILNQARQLDVPVSMDRRHQLHILPDSSPQCGLCVQDRLTGLSYTTNLLGPYQRDNLALVLACVDQLRAQGLSIPAEAVQTGLRTVRWPVRFQWIPQASLLLDGSHNADGFDTLGDGLERYFANRPTYWLLSLRTNRSPQLLIQLLKRFPTPLGVITTHCEPQHLYHPPEQLALELTQAWNREIPVTWSPSPTEALDWLQAQITSTHEQQPIGVVTGSLYTAGAVLHALERSNRLSGLESPAQA